MKILAFTDLHGSKQVYKEIKKKSKEADLIVCAGDLTIMMHEVDYFLSELNKLNIKTLIVQGNHEEENEFKNKIKKYSNIIDLNKKKFEFKDIIFLGFGGGGFSLIDKEFEVMSKKWMNIENKKIILITHAPPYKTKLDYLHGKHVGNKSIRKFIEKKQPIYAFSGHLHENFKIKDKIGNTICVNPGDKGEIYEI